MQTLITLAIEPQLAQKREKKTTSADHVKEMKWFDRHSFLFIFFFVIAKVWLSVQRIIHDRITIVSQLINRERKVCCET